MPADRRLDSVAGCATFPTARQPPRSGDRQNHLASEAAGYTPGTPSRRRTTPRTPETSEGNQPQRQDASSLPSPDTISCGNVCEGDTHLQKYWNALKLIVLTPSLAGYDL